LKGEVELGDEDFSLEFEAWMRRPIPQTLKVVQLQNATERIPLASPFPDLFQTKIFRFETLSETTRKE
jgi:hypothetical protein